MADDPSKKHFFKFIPPGFLFNLSIPKSFMAKLNEWRGKKKAILRRGFHKWAVEINSDGGVFGDGWRKFVTDNGVQELDFIVFKHLGNMVFEFHVFDQSTCERHYYYTPEDLLDEDIDVKDQSLLVESPMNSFHRQGNDIFTTRIIHLQHFMLYTLVHYKCIKHEMLWMDNCCCEYITTLHERWKTMNCKPAKRTTDNNRSQRKDGDDCSFVTIMTPYSIEAARLHVRVNFARSNGLYNNIGDTQIVIIDETERSWTATLRNRTTEIQLRGWRKLILANHLERGDVCKFELVKSKSGKVPLYKLYNLGKKPSNKDMQIKETGSTSCYMATSSTRYFISTMKAWSIKRSCLYLPNEFARKNGLFQKEAMILKNVNESSWTVEIKNFRNKFCYIQRGWKAFCIANNLREGDQFKLELVSNGEIPIMYFTL